MASEGAGGTIGAAAGVVGTEPLMIATEHSDVVQAEVHPLQDGIAIRIKGTVTAMSPKGAAMVGRALAEGVRQLDRYP